MIRYDHNGLSDKAKPAEITTPVFIGRDQAIGQPNSFPQRSYFKHFFPRRCYACMHTMNHCDLFHAIDREIC